MGNPPVNIGKEHIPHHKNRKETKSTYEEYFFLMSFICVNMENGKFMIFFGIFHVNSF